MLFAISSLSRSASNRQLAPKRRAVTPAWRLLCCCVLAAGVPSSAPVIAQWAGTTNIYNTNSGNVGVGTGPFPQRLLDVNGIARAKVQDNGGQVFNAKAYGAVGDGTTNDAPAIQTAINAAGKGITYLPPGTYLVNSTLNLSANAGAWLMGAGPQNTIIKLGSTTADGIKMSDAVTGTIPGTKVTDLSIVPNVPRTGGAAIIWGIGERFLVQNVQIGVQGAGIATGNGIVCVATSGQVAANFWIDHCDIEISGAFVGIKGINAGDYHITTSWIRGPVANGGAVAGSVGIDVGAAAIHAVDVESSQFEKGIYVHPSDNQTSAWSSFQNVRCDQISLYGWRFAATGTGKIWGFVLIGCWAGSNLTTSLTGTGIRIENGDGYLLHDFRAINNGGHGVDVYAGATNIEINGGIVAGNSVAQVGYAQGIAFEPNVVGFRVSNIRSGQAVGQPSNQGWGIYISSGCNNYVVTSNDTRLNQFGGIQNVPGTSATRVLANNL